jgi:signal transduction histidine kinase
MSANERNDDRLAVLAHELRNPLGALANAADVLAHYAARDPAIARVSEIVQRQTAVMCALVEELLDVSRLDNERLALRMRELDLRDVVRNALEDHREQIEQAGLRWEIELDLQPVPVVGDQVKLAQVLGNLLSNAVKFTPPPGSVHVAVQASDGCARLTVRDTGVGIPPDMLGVVFHRFRQASRGGHGGLGLGLPIAKGIVELHGGEITAASGGAGQGCMIAIRLPIAAETRAG